MMPKVKFLFAAIFICVIVVCFCVCPSDGSGNITWTQGRQFRRDNFYDNRKFGDSDSLDLVVTTFSQCTSWCSSTSWCTGFFYTASSGKCSLHATVFVDRDSARVSVGNTYYKQVVDWCQPQLERPYIRFADMCLYIETDPSKTATSWSTADTKCDNMGMRLVSNITPIKMEALVNITRKNPSIIGYIYIGMRRRPQTDTGTLQWLDDQPVDMAALGPYWGSGEPDGSATGEHCVVIDTDRRSGLSDVPCGTKHPFVCELLKP